MGHGYCVTLIQRFGSAANLNIHLHALVLDGVYGNPSATDTIDIAHECPPAPAATAAPVFHVAGAPTHAVLEALLGKIITRILRLAALVPCPRLHLIRFHGVLAPHATLRKAVVPDSTATAAVHAGDCAHTPAHPPAVSAKGRMRWAPLLKRVFDIDIEQCPHCGG